MPVTPSTLPAVLGRWGLDTWLRGSEVPVAIEILQRYKAPHAFGPKTGRHRCSGSLENDQGGS